jgi:hypothetical protein
MAELNLKYESALIVPDGQKIAGLNVLSMHDERWDHLVKKISASDINTIYNNILIINV